MDDDLNDVEEWLDSVRDGIVSTIDFILTAHNEPASGKRHVLLKTLVDAASNISDQHKTTFFGRMALILELTPSQARRMSEGTVEWLFDGRARPGRIHAWIEVSTVETSPPWPGYPFEPRPSASPSAAERRRQ